MGMGIGASPTLQDTQHSFLAQPAKGTAGMWPGPTSAEWGSQQRYHGNDSWVAACSNIVVGYVRL